MLGSAAAPGSVQPSGGLERERPPPQKPEEGWRWLPTSPSALHPDERCKPPPSLPLGVRPSACMGGVLGSPFQKGGLSRVQDPGVPPRWIGPFRSQIAKKGGEAAFPTVSSFLPPFGFRKG